MLDLGNLKLNYLDYMLVVNRDYTIAYGSRYDLHPDKENPEKQRYCRGKNFFEVYPTIRREASSVIKCMTTGEIVINKYQKFVDFTGKVFCTHNITLPLIRQGKIIGAVELSRDVTTVDNVDNKSAGRIEEEFDVMAESLKKDSREITFEDILTQNSEMMKNIEKARMMASMPHPTLIYGETGTGKELFAQAMIRHSGFPPSKAVIQNCASVPENLLESILFGTTKGAYTGAENRKGLFEEADGGIFFLDELNSLPYHVQGKLLRVLQDGTFRPVGAGSEKKVDVKIIAAINMDPMEAIEKKVLRSDLFYRLSSGMIYLPPLRHRKDDILFYTKHYITICNEIFRKNVKGITEELKAVFLEYRWEGNVRELKNIIESMISVTESEYLSVKDLPAYMYDRIRKNSPGSADEPVVKRRETADESSLDNLEEIRQQLNLKKNLEKTERDLIEKTLRLTGWNKTKAGELLGIPRQTLKYKMDKWDIKEHYTYGLDQDQ